jgi:hypothetical protein
MPVSETGRYTPQDAAMEALFAMQMGQHPVPLAQQMQDPFFLQRNKINPNQRYGADTFAAPPVGADPSMAMKVQGRAVPRRMVPVDPNHPMVRALQQDAVY